MRLGLTNAARAHSSLQKHVGQKCCIMKVLCHCPYGIPVRIKLDDKALTSIGRQGIAYKLVGSTVKGNWAACCQSGLPIRS